MKSTIKIDIDNDGMPVLLIKLNHDTSDVRDKLLNRFFKHTETSNTLTFKIVGIGGSEGGYSYSDIEIYPVKDVMLFADGSAAFGCVTAEQAALEMLKDKTEPLPTE